MPWLPAARDNPPILGPAGTVHLSLADWLTFCGTQLEGGDYLTADTRRVVQTPVADMNDAAGRRYALGWIVGPDGSLAHEGSNTFCHAIAVVNVEKNRALVAATSAPQRDASMAALRAAMGAGR